MILVIIGASTWLVIKTSQAERDPRQEIFLAGQLPNPGPAGKYNGTTDITISKWQGKQFNPDNKTGYNLFRYGSNVESHYFFKTKPGKGLRDHELDVLKLNYNVSNSPFWLRLFLVDEIVETAPNEFLGKAHIQIIPRVAFTVGYFTLEPAEN